MGQTIQVAGTRGGTEESDAVATIAHEVRTPLTSLLGYARMLRRDWNSIDEHRRTDMFEVIESQGRRILRLVDDLLEAARLGTGSSRMRRDPLDLHGILADAVRTAEGLVRGHHVRVEASQSPADLFGDAVAIEHVLTNLLENAIKYSPDGSTVFVSVEDVGAEVRVAVRDEGSGIAAADVPHIFERFRRANGNETRGVGLGLYIARGLVSAHGGRVWIQSPQGGGTTVTFSLPRRAARD